MTSAETHEKCLETVREQFRIMESMSNVRFWPIAAICLNVQGNGSFLEPLKAGHSP